ncbi:MAG: carboxypeptidase M32 [Candidatus Izimaplasma sp.]|nr:carboxypeptidase M32 [Candidatus Izimaplasma bacterium]
MDLKKKFRELVMKRKGYQYVLNIVHWDSATEAPKEAFERRAEMTSMITKDMFKLRTSQEYQDVVYGLYEQLDNLDDTLKREIKKEKKDLDKIVKIPEDEYVEYQKLIELSQHLWEEAKETNDWDKFKDKLEKIVAFNKKFVDYYDIDDLPYNIKLDEFEEGMTIDIYDEFFGALKKDLVPFVQRILTEGKPLKVDVSKDAFDPDKQKDFCNYLMGVFDFNQDRGLMKESVHPFTWNTHPKDVRFTTRYLENYVFSSIFAAIHELGHALYEQQIDSKWNDTLLSGGTSMGIHESQSRFYENIIGRSKAFWEVHLPKFKETFPTQLKDVSVNDFYRNVNKVESSLIRVEADELTYPLHIMLRYEIEKKLFNNEITVDELPTVWNDSMEEYLGIRPETDRDGVLQDVHWSAGMFGYFPTYALGTAYSAQILHTMKQELDLEKLVKDNEIEQVNAWLKDKIHHFGGSKSPKELLKEVTGESFNPTYYIEYLKEKYTEIYL